MSSSATIRSEIYDREERKQQYQAHIRGLNAYDRHKKFLNDYVRFYGKDKPVEVKLPVKTDQDTLREGYRFIRSEEDDLNPSWEQRLVKRYYDKLFKEYCIADMSRYKTGKMGLRWRTEKEVMSGKGQFMCGSKHCDEKDGLASYEVNFAYYEAGEHKQALVKLVACERCAEKLYYKKRKEEERSNSKEKKKHKRKWNQSSSEEGASDEEERRKGKKGKSKLEGCDREAKDDENFDEFMEGMFPSKGDS
ncbi:hypothetical protein AALP_AAs72951U000400 [Arabis alpina]|uniref:Protein FRA10AC1 n=1 Tax=Arabis alpina TaxID=50452 RepID=A0A087FZ51_ARAAL|nr:hypothetical protein AALP_AAs72951U000400 [Arabis alpina]